jgi:hypothetical protein
MAQVAKIEAFVFSLCEHRGKQRYLKCIQHELIYRHQTVSGPEYDMKISLRIV